MKRVKPSGVAIVKGASFYRLSRRVLWSARQLMWKKTCTSQRFSLKTQKKLFLKEQTWMKINPPCLSIHPLWPWPTLDTNSSLKQILFGGVAWLLSQPITTQNCQRKLGKHGKHDATCLRLRGLSIIHPPIQSIHPEWQTKIQTFRGPNSQRLQVSTSDYSDLGH